MSGHDEETTTPGPSQPQREPEPAATEQPQADRFKPVIAITLSLLIVLGTGLAILQVQAGSRESNTARETTRTAVNAMRANVVADTVAGLEPQLEAERAFLAFRRPLTPRAPSLVRAADIPTSKAEVAGNLHVAQLAVPDLGASILLPALQTQAERLTLQQRAMAATRITWNDRSTQYTTVIAVLTVAIFLVGFGLVVGGPVRGAAYALGVAVGLFAAASATWIHSLPIPSTPASVITATARGQVLSGNGHFHAAIADYDAAIRHSSEYAPAYSGRARARLLAGNPDYPTTKAVTNLRGGLFNGALSDARTARRLDNRDTLATSLLALTSFYRGDYAQALSAVDSAININSKVPDLWLLRSAVDVGLGGRAGAAAGLAHALGILRGAAPSQETRLLASTYLSYMAWLERHDPTHAGVARGLANRVVSVETAFTLAARLSQRAPATGTASITGLRFAGGRLRMRLSWSRLPAGTALSAIGYERPLPQGAWTQPTALALFASVSGSGRRDIAVPLKRACAPTAVRVDIYLNGIPTLVRVGPGVAPTC